MSTTSYTVTAVPQLMENHIPATAFDTGQGFSALEDATTTTIVLAIGSDGVLRALAEADQSATKWNIANLSTDLQPEITMQFGTSATYVATQFSASLLETSDTLTALVALRVAIDGNAETTQDLLYQLSGPSGVAPSSWLADSTQRSWTALPFDAATPPYSLTPSNLLIAQLVNQPGPAGTSMAVALVENEESNGELVPYHLTAGTTPVWNPILYEQDLSDLMATAVAADQNGHAGLYKLYTGGGSASLTFSYFGPASPFALDVPENPTSGAGTLLAGTPYFLVTNDSSDHSQGTLTLFGAAVKGSAGTPIFTSPLVAGMTQLSAVVADDLLVVWGVNAAGQLISTRCVAANASDASAWTPPLVMMSSVTDASGVTGASSSGYGVIAVGALAEGTLTGGVTSGPQFLSLNNTTALWETTVLPQPSPTDCITLQSYTTRVAVMNGVTPASTVPVSISSDQDCTLLVNASSFSFSANTAQSIPTDANGGLNIIYETSGIASPNLTFIVTNPDGTNSTVNAFPANDTTNSMASIDASTLQSKGLVKGSVTSSQVTVAANNMNALATASGTLPRASAVSATQRRAAITAAQPLGDSILADIGDLIQAGLNDVEALVTAIYQEGVLLVTIAGQAFTALIQTAEDALNGILLVLRSIGSFFENLFEALAFLFDWDQMVEAGQQIYQFYLSILNEASNHQSGLQSQVNAYLKQLASTTKSFQPGNSFQQVSATDPTTAANSQTQPPPQPGGQDLHSNPQVGWMNDRMGNVSSGTPASSSTSIHQLRGSTNPLITAVDTFGTDFENCVSAIVSDVKSFAEGDTNSQAFLQNVVGALVTMGVDDAEAISQAFFDSFEEIVGGAQASLTAPYDIPVLSGLYYDAVKEPLNLLSLLSLIQGILLTIVYGLVEDQGAGSLLSGLSGTAGAKQFFETLSNPAPSLIGKGGRGTRPHSLSDDSNDALIYITGIQLMIQSIMNMVMGSLEITIASADEDADTGPSEASLAFLYKIDIWNRILRGFFELGFEDDISSNAEGNLAIVNLATAFIGLCVTFIPTSSEDEDPSSVVVVYKTMDALLSMIWGIMDFSNGCPQGFNDAGDTILEGVCETMELPCMLMNHYIPPLDNFDLTTATAAVLGIRSIMFFGAGCCRMARA